jgi:hypothetical protein
MKNILKLFLILFSCTQSLILQPKTISAQKERKLLFFTTPNREQERANNRERCKLKSQRNIRRKGPSNSTRTPTSRSFEKSRK